MYLDNTLDVSPPPPDSSPADWLQARSCASRRASYRSGFRLGFRQGALVVCGLTALCATLAGIAFTYLL